MRRELEPLLSEIRCTHLEILGGNLVGLYLHGSLALGGFNPRRSDVDYIAVVQARPRGKRACGCSRPCTG